MVLIKEFRIPMPFTLEDYKIGQRYSVARTSNENTNTSEGIELIENKPYDHIEPNDPEKKVCQGVYTKKIYHLKSLIPGWVSTFLPDSALKLYEDAWDVYPYCKTVITFPFLGDRFQFVIESRHTSGEFGKVENIHNIPDNLLKKRVVEFIDIGKDQVDKKHYKKEEDPSIFTSKNFGKGPLSVTNWMKESKDIICCYKLVTIRCKVTGLQSKLESYMMNFEKSVFLKFHQQVFCWMDDWFGKSMLEIIEMEDKIFSEMNSKILKDAPKKENDKLETTTTTASTTSTSTSTTISNPSGNEITPSVDH